MSKSWNRAEVWIALIFLPFGVLLTGIAGLHTYMTTTAERLHPDPEGIPSVTRSDPSVRGRWADAVDSGRQIMRAGLSEQNLPGLSVAVGVAGDIVWAEAFGWADLETKAAVTPETRFRIGTASMTLTSAAVGLLLEEDRLDLDEEIQTYVPEFPMKEAPVRLGQLMGHVAGIRNDGGDEGPLFSQHCERPVNALPAFADRTLLFEPGTQFRLSSYGWILVSAAVEAGAGEPFLAVMQKRVFEPLGMADTVADSTSQPIPNRATFYFPRYAADPRHGLHLMRTVDYSCYAGSSVFLTTPSDLVRFGIAINGGRLLRPDTVEVLQSSQRLVSGEETGYGLGWDLETVDAAGGPISVVGHDGESLGGMVASLMILPRHGVVVAVASNISYADTFALAANVAQAFVQ